MNCQYCNGELIPNRLFCPDCGKAKEDLKPTGYNPEFRSQGPSESEVNRILESAGITGERDRSKFLSELASGVRKREEVLTGESVGQINRRMA